MSFVYVNDNILNVQPIHKHSKYFSKWTAYSIFCTVDDHDVALIVYQVLSDLYYHTVTLSIVNVLFLLCKHSSTGKAKGDMLL